MQYSTKFGWFLQSVVLCYVLIWFHYFSFHQYNIIILSSGWLASFQTFTPSTFCCILSYWLRNGGIVHVYSHVSITHPFMSTIPDSWLLQNVANRKPGRQIRVNSPLMKMDQTVMDGETGSSSACRLKGIQIIQVQKETPESEAVFAQCRAVG